ncbi:MAG TPA: MmcQ/YjbR family DNA-binding protein [Rhizomicrobium sp.]|jgi:hypothetical protein
MKKKISKTKGVTAAEVKKLALSFPEAHEKPSYNRPAFFIAKKFFTRVRSEDASLVMGVEDMETRDMMLELDPETYFITDHYKDWPFILVRLSHITKDELRTMLERRFQKIAPKKLLKPAEEKPPAKKAAKKPMKKAKKKAR